MLSDFFGVIFLYFPSNVLFMDKSTLLRPNHSNPTFTLSIWFVLLKKFY